MVRLAVAAANKLPPSLKPAMMLKSIANEMAMMVAPSCVAVVLQNLLAQGRADQLVREFCRHVMLVETRIDLGQLDRVCAPALRNNLHGEVRFAIGDAAWHRCPSTGTKRGIKAADAEAHVDT